LPHSKKAKAKRAIEAKRHRDKEAEEKVKKAIADRGFDTSRISISVLK